MCSRALGVALISVLLSLANRPLSAQKPGAPELDVPDLYRIWVDKKIGFIDRTGNVVVEPQFDWAYEFSEGICQVTKDRVHGYIDRNGNWLFNVKTQDDRPFRSGVAIIYTDGGQGIVDQSGRIIDCPFDWIEDFSEGLAAVKVYPRDKQGTKVFSTSVGQSLEKWGFVNTAGKLVIPINYTAARAFSEGLAPVYVGGFNCLCSGPVEGKWGFINKSGKFVIEPQFRSAQGFSEGLAVVSFDGEHFGWIDPTGKFAIEPRRLTMALPFHDGVACIRGAPDSVPGWKDFGYITKKGEVLVHPAFDHFSALFSEGLTEARQQPRWNAQERKWIEGKYGYVDKRGNWIIEPQYCHTDPFRNGLAFVQNDESMAYIDKAGRAVWSSRLPARSK